MNANLSILQIIFNASGVVQAIMALLLFASLMSWMVIFAKRGMLSTANKQSTAFETRFWSGGTLSDIYESMRRSSDKEIGVAMMFRAGFEEYSRQQSTRGTDPGDALAAVQRQMRVTQAREVEKLEGGLPLLATVGSISVYVGLFGTVWGIMNAFIAIGNVKQATLASVAPGIAEALIATAMGLFASIPAIVAYNFLTSSVDRLEGRYSTFCEELTGIIDRGLRGGGGRA